MQKIAAAVARLAPKEMQKFDHEAAQAFVWDADANALHPIKKVNCIDAKLLRGIDRQKQLLFENTRYFARHLPANNALLWGARGGGKSSLIKATHAAISKEYPLKLIEIHRDDIHSLPRLLNLIKETPVNCIVFCDDLSFDADDASYKSLKVILEGGIEGRPDNVVFYATSNRRHMMSRQMIENEQSTAINPYETAEEKLSLSDRFGLWIGFHHCLQETYLDMIRGYVDYYQLGIDEKQWQAQALEWAMQRGSRCGRVAWQFVQILAAQHNKNLVG